MLETEGEYRIASRPRVATLDLAVLDAWANVGLAATVGVRSEDTIRTVSITINARHHNAKGGSNSAVCGDEYDEARGDFAAAAMRGMAGLGCRSCGNN